MRSIWCELVKTEEYKRHWTELTNKKVLLATEEIGIKFADFVAPLMEQMRYLHKKNLNLRRTRDLLLPKLVSGEVDVSGEPSVNG